MEQRDRKNRESFVSYLRRLMEETRFLDSFDESGADMVRSFHHDRRRLIEEAVTTLGSVDTTPVKDQEHCYLSELEALRGNLDGAISEMEKAIAIHPELGHQHARLGLLWAEAGCHQSAVQSLERAVALPPKGDAALLSPNGYPPYHIELSGIYQKLGRLDEALRHASRAIELSPGHAGYHYHRGHILLLMDDLDGAETEILRSTELDPGLIEARALLAGIQMRKGDWIASRRNWERVLEIDPTRSDAHYFSGLSRHMINDLNGARDCYLKCLALDPDHEDARFRLSEAMTTAGEWTGALEQVQAAIGLNSESADFRLLQSHVLLMLNRFDEAKSASKNARKLKCGVWRWLILRGSIELRKWIEIGWRNGAHDREHFK